ncbi:hypothetical protein Lal_00030203 [Lupinus albus]|uniref:Putative aldose 1-/Glucose-6-phosphate 1-epimerase, galactose mutarotase-like protein n=1 Tax=Lupinus albus TaxID=3870 RepID=A0A6A5MFW3_LUPAL|nr:putative aldose 1-/Glucose-6-phosphate 1-epimerase, galactose mutarotase-like protein [Lupinus albus]KAF1870893.1 hypothetical protein Lal_00030203 [Lupinus albus]
MISLNQKLLGPEYRINELRKTNGYDTDYVLDGSRCKEIKVAAIVHDKKSGRVMKISTSAPGLQIYAAIVTPENPDKHVMFIKLSTKAPYAFSPL